MGFLTLKFRKKLVKNVNANSIPATEERDAWDEVGKELAQAARALEVAGCEGTGGSGNNCFHKN